MCSFSLKKQEGHCCVPIKKDGPDAKLSNWVAKIRREHAALQRGQTSDYLTAHRRQKLTAIGFAFQVRDGKIGEGVTPYTEKRILKIPARLSGSPEKNSMGNIFQSMEGVQGGARGLRPACIPRRAGEMGTHYAYRILQAHQ